MTHPERWPRSSDVICPECENRYTPDEWDAVSVEMPNGELICEDCKGNHKKYGVFEDQYGVEEK